MRFGTLGNISYHESVHGSAWRYYGAILDQIVTLEELGYDSVWFGEHHYAKYSIGSPAAMAVAAATLTPTYDLVRVCHCYRCITRCDWPRSPPWPMCCR